MKTHLTSLHAWFVAAALAAAPLTVTAATVSELLEKGIYTEETKGDLEGAIAIYQQLISEAKAGQSLAAQAQFRLAQCFLKKNRTAEATAAFEKLIRDFPDEKELIAKAREHLPGDLALNPAPWATGERMQLTLKLAAGTDIGIVAYSADLLDEGGRKIWRLGGRMSGAVESVSTVDADAGTFVPLKSHWKHQMLGEATATYGAGEVVVEKSGQRAVIPAEKVVYDNEQVIFVMRRLPLAVGYKTVLPVVATLGASAVLPIGIEVVGTEVIEVPAGKFECFRVQMNVGQTFWLSNDAHRYLVKFDAGGASAHLSSVTHAKSGAPVVLDDDALGISIAAPADWTIHLRESGDRPGQQTVHLIDPAADLHHAQLRLVNTESLEGQRRVSARTWMTEDFVERIARHFKDARLRTESFQNVAVAGRAGISSVGDFVDKEKPMTVFSVYALGPKRSEHFEFACPAEKFDALRPVFEKIVASYRTK